MIRVLRPEPSPEFLFRAENATLKLIKEVDAMRNSGYRQERLRFDAGLWGRAKPLLFEAFHAKCVYCESQVLSRIDLDIELFRPKVGAINGDGAVARDHYYWLAYDWNNLMVACKTCNATKRSHFPVIGRRIEFNDPLEEEKPLLLDPCRDQPEEHLIFEDDGNVRAASDRGAATIAVLGLNRAELVRARRGVVVEVERLLNAVEKYNLQGDDSGLAEERLKAAMSDAAPFAAMVRQWDERRKQPRAVIQEVVTSASGMAAEATVTAAATSISRTVLVESIKITNFRAIEDLTVSFRLPEVDSASWLSLLGENGSGKSSVLQALAVALGGKAGLEQLEVTVPGFTCDRLINAEKDKASIKVLLTSEPNVIELKLTRGKKPKFTKGGEGVPSMVLAYGATRLLPSSSEPVLASTKDAEHRVANLFDPFRPLVDAEKWLCSLDDEAFTMASWTLRDLLQIEQGVGDFDRADDRIYLTHHGRRCTLASLSSGYQCIVALATDIMQASPKGILDKSQITGIVLIDEIDVHLHPRWKMEVVSKLRMSFPSVQFVVTTHEPLALRGCKGEEVILMENTEKGIAMTTDLPDPSEMRVDQLLTSKFFGLHSTIDPKIEQLFARYYILLAKDSLTGEEKDELSDLQKRTAGYGVLGYTRRDQIAYDCIDRFLSKESTAVNPGELRKETINEVVAMWERIETWQEGRG